MWASAVVVEIGWFFTQGRWQPLLSLSGWLVLAAAVLAVRMALTAGGGQYLALLFLAQMAHALTFAAHHSAVIALINGYFDGRLRARGQALYSVIGYGLSGVVGGLVGGWVSSRWGLAAVFWLSTCTALAALGAALGMQRCLARSTPITAR